MKEEIEQCIASGMNHHITKPIKQDILEQVLRKFLKSRSNIQLSFKFVKYSKIFLII